MEASSSPTTGADAARLPTNAWADAVSIRGLGEHQVEMPPPGGVGAPVGLKENVIIGELSPAGTGINRYRNIQVQSTEEARAAAYALPTYDDGYYSPDVFGTGTGTGAAVPLDVYDFRARLR